MRQTTHHRVVLALGLFMASLWPGFTAVACAADLPTVKLQIKNKTFHPSRITIPAGQQVRILVRNQDGFPAEFESYDTHTEKVIPGHSAISVYIGPLKAGEYSFFNDFHQSSKGKLIVKGVAE